MKKIIFTSIIAFGLTAQGQDLETFYSYSLDWSNINNAMVGASPGFQGLVMSRTQFNDVPGSPKNIMALIGANITDRQGVGIKMINDSRGVFNTTRFDAVYSQQFDFNTEKNSYVRFGLSFGALNSSLDLTNINNRDGVLATGDPEITSSKFNYTHFVSGAGVIAGIGNLELGVSAPHMLESSNGFDAFILGTAAYQVVIPSSKLSVKPAVIYHNRPEQENLTDGFLTVGWNNTIKAIGGYTSDERMRLGGSVIFKDFEVGYMSEAAGANSISNNSHEIAVRITLNSGKRREVVSIRSNIQKLLDETRALSVGNYDKDYLRKRLAEIDKELDALLVKNSKESSREVQAELDELEGQILMIIEKFDLQNE